MKWAPIAVLAADVNDGKVKAEELVKQSLEAMRRHAEYRAIIATLDESALKRARDIDEAVVSGKSAGRLAGVPFIAKDNYLVFGAETTAASNILRGFTAPYQATVVERLEAEGAICVAKANLDAFAHGASTENSDFFTTSNAKDAEKVAGGSSGGSAVAVALEMTPFALGTDTGGSTRQPASFNGCVGFKPTYGLISRSGIVAMASSTDTVGTFARTVEDASLVVDVMAGPDELDSTTIPRESDGYVVVGDMSIKGTKVGVVKEWMSEGIDEDVRIPIELAITRLKEAGADVVEVSMPSLPLALAVYYIVCPAEISSNLARHDGQRYGHWAKDARDLEASYTETRMTGFGREAKRRIMIGTYVLSSGYYDAFYNKAQTVRTKLMQEFDEAFRDVDFMVGPVAPNTAFKIGENVDDPLKMYLVDMMTVGPSMVGVPGISLPCAVDEGAMPVGLQVIAPQRKDRELLQFSSAVERVII